jgi:hypothetical protein
VADYRYSQVYFLDFANETTLFEHKTGKPWRRRTQAEGVFRRVFLKIRSGFFACLSHPFSGNATAPECK